MIRLVVLAACISAASCNDQMRGTNAFGSPTVSEIDSVLDRLEKAGAAADNLDCLLEWTVEDSRVFETSVRFGRLRFLRKPLRIRVDFTELHDSGTVKPRNEWHLFDGHWYTEAKELSRTVVRREIVRANEPSHDLFKIGSGPFPLPVGQKKSDILAHFTVKVTAGSNYDILECTPRPRSMYADDYKTIRFHVSRRLGIPVRIEYEQKKDDKNITVKFSVIRINSGLAEKDFRVDFPKGWHWHSKRLPQQEAE